jgi:hypothetical protein
VSNDAAGKRWYDPETFRAAASYVIVVVIAAAAAFVATLERHGVPATVRVRRGIDIDAGCGQLKSELLRRLRASG